MSLAIIILSAGKAPHEIRKAKVMHTLAGKPMLQHVIDTPAAFSRASLAVYVGSGADEVDAILQNQQIKNTICKNEQKRPGHAVEKAKRSFQNSEQRFGIVWRCTLINGRNLQDLMNSGDNKTPSKGPHHYWRIPQHMAVLFRDYFDDKYCCITEEKDR